MKITNTQCQWSEHEYEHCHHWKPAGEHGYTKRHGDKGKNNMLRGVAVSAKHAHCIKLPSFLPKLFSSFLSSSSCSTCCCFASCRSCSSTSSVIFLLLVLFLLILLALTRIVWKWVHRLRICKHTPQINMSCTRLDFETQQLVSLILTQY